MKKTIYLDHASTTPLHPEVYSVMLPYIQNTYGNPSSIHHKGREAAQILDNARAFTARTLDVLPREIIFTSSGTEANNLALHGVAKAYQKKGKHILLSPIEHISILEAADRLQEEGFEIEYLTVDRYGQISIDEVISRVRPHTILISLMYANNEIGTIEPVPELARHLKHVFGDTRPLLHTDACQAAGQLQISPKKLGVDLMTLNGGKIYGPKGSGMLYAKDAITLTPHIVGGTQEYGRRAGTENIPNCVGFAHALFRAVTDTPTTCAQLTYLRNILRTEIEERIPDAHINGHPTYRLPNNVHFSFPALEGESLVLLLDTYGICASTGSACSAHNLQPSHVLRAIKQDTSLMHGSLRLTLGTGTTEEDIHTTVEALVTCVERLRAITPSYMPQ